MKSYKNRKETIIEFKGIKYGFYKDDFQFFIRRLDGMIPNSSELNVLDYYLKTEGWMEA
jgi:hypothetical protein